MMHQREKLIETARAILRALRRWRRAKQRRRARSLPLAARLALSDQRREPTESKVALGSKGILRYEL